MKEHAQTVEDLIGRIRAADADEFATLERSLVSDTRVTVKKALDVARRRIQAEQAEAERLTQLYASEYDFTHGACAVGLDEVGRGPLAGPLTIGAVVLPAEPKLAGLNDSKQVPADKRAELARAIKDCAHAWAVVHIPPADIDAQGMSACLHKAFSSAVRDIEAQGITPEVILLDGNPLHLDEREVSVVHGDARCASIAAASIIAKVERDELMCSYAQQYPVYGFEKNKGYASAEHQQAIRTCGLSPIHRASFCTAFLQESLF